ncbi:hypothetical protein IJT17_04270 [bacterium]|nr:hypothetical protein [bacterium]
MVARIINKPRITWVLLVLLFLAGAIRVITDTTISPNAHEYEYYVTYCGNLHSHRHQVNIPDYQIPVIAPKYLDYQRVHLVERSLESNGYLFSWFVEHIWVRWFYTPQGGRHMRIVPGLLGMLTLYLVYVLGTMVHSRRAGLFAMFLLGIHGMHITHSVHGRFYTLNEVFCVLSTILLLKLVEKPSFMRALGYAVSVLGVVASQLLSIILLLPQLAYLVIYYPQRKKAWGMALGILALAVGLFCALCWRDSAGYGRFDYGHPLDNVVFFAYLVYLTASNLLINIINADYFAPRCPLTVSYTNYYALAIMLVTWLSLAAAVKRRRGSGPLSPQRVRLLWAIRLLALGGYWFFSVYVKNIVVTRNYSWMIPFFCVLTAVGMAMLPKVCRWLLLTLMLGATMCTCSTLYFQGRGEEFILELVRHYRRPGELVLIDDWIKLNQLLSQADYMITPTAVKSPLFSSMYMLNPENLGVDKDGTRETIIRSRSMSIFLRMLKLYRGDFMHGKRVWVIAHDMDELIYKYYVAMDDRTRVLMYRDFGSEAIFYIEFK